VIFGTGTETSVRDLAETVQQTTDSRSEIVHTDLRPADIDHRRLHHLPFSVLQYYTSYKASFEGIPTAWINPEYTSQRCPMCGHTERANRTKKRFKCRSCEHQDHTDRGASINIAVKRIEKHQDWNVPALNSLPQVRKVRRRASGAVDAPTVTHPTVRGDQADGRMGVSN
jgi:putative transposase